MNEAFAFIYARTDSHRLPGKIFLEIGGYKVIDIVHSRAKRMDVDQVVVLTTDRNVDDSLAEYCSLQGYNCFRGHSTDLVTRTLQAIDAYKPSIVVRINSDSPFVEPVLVNAGLKHFSAKDRDESGKPDMISNIVTRSFPYGVSVECISAEAYARLATEAAPEEREHMTQHLYRLSHRLSLHGMQDNSGDNSKRRLTLDTAMDLQTLTLFSEGRNIITTPYWEIMDVNPPEPVFFPYVDPRDSGEVL